MKPRIILWGSLLLVCALASGLPAAETNWPAESFRRVVTGADAKQADKMLDEFAMIARSGADTVILTGHLRGEGWFPSKLATRSADLPVEDVVAEGVARAHRLGMRAVIYVGGPMRQVALQDKADWFCRDAAGKVLGGDTSLCLLSPFGDWLIAYLSELAQNAPVDGIWLDGYPQGPLACQCPHCAAAYRRETGEPLPPSRDPRDPAVRRYVLWWQKQCEGHARRLVEAVHKVQPGCALFANVNVGRAADSWRHTPDGLCAILDCPSVEQFWDVDHQGDPLQAQFVIQRVLSAADGKPVEVYVPLLPHHVDCTTALPDVEMMARNLTVLANGAVPQPTSASGRAASLSLLMQEIRAREPWLKGARRTRFCGVVASALTALQYGQDKPEPVYWEEVKGWLRALTEEHLPVELISDQQLEQGHLDGLQVLVLPATACVSAAARGQIEKFAQAGGGLVATAVASLAEENGTLTNQFALAGLFGAQFLRVEERERLPAFIALKPQDHPLANGEWVEQALWKQWSGLGHHLDAVGLPGKYVRFRAAPDRAVAWRYIDNAPAIITGQSGQGRVTYIGPEVGAAYYRYSYPYLRSLMAESVRQAARQQPRDTVTAPRMVQATFFEQPVPRKSARRVIHLLNEVSSFGRASLSEGALPVRDEVVPIGGVRVVSSGRAGRIHLEPEGKTLRPHHLGDGRFEVELPPFGLHTLLVIEP